MKVLILGPSIGNKASGGVAVFDEGLFNGFKEIGDEVFLVSANKSINLDNILISNREISPKRIFGAFGKISTIIKRIKPDVVISSLQYSLGIKRYKIHHKKCTYIQVLHGFPCEINGKFKAWLINQSAKYTRKHFDYVVTVSFLSYAINKKIIQIPCDKIIYNGCNIVRSNNLKERIYDFIYIGRLFGDKEVEMIADSFLLLKKSNPSFRLAIAGYGELENLFTSGKYVDSGIEFLGKINQTEVQSLLESSKFFISMNPLEPFGIVFNEALLCGCNIITQSSSGCAPLFIKKDYFHIADCTNSCELSKKLVEISNSFHIISDSEMEEISFFASFKRVALEYKKLATKDE